LPARRWFAKPAWICGLLLFAIILGEKSAYAVADVLRDRDITARGRLFPLYQPLTVKDVLGKRLGLIDLSTRERVQLSTAGVLIHYPLSQLKIAADAPKPNILIVVIDSLRHDMINSAVMPNLARWSNSARRFENHLSGGNATRFGIFSLVYGLHGSYWSPFLNEQAPPVLVTTLVDAGYEPLVLSSASMNSPEFRSTCWVTIEDMVFDQLEGAEKYQRDRLLASRFNDWLGERDAAQPFFAFALMDSPHQTYSVDPNLTPFVPFIERVDYLALGEAPKREQVDLIRNRYKNACATADESLGAMLDGLERRGLAQNTIVVVTGDHGEEFYEHGHFGHTSNFTAAQTWVGFVMRGPGIEVGTEPRPTSHIDLVPTLLEQLGVDPSRRGDYSTGVNLLEPPAQRSRVIAGWQDVGVWVDGGILYIPMEGHKGLVEAYGYDWKLLTDDRAVIQGAQSALKQLGEESRRFLR
jgi:membrane-anchored protein YejM (alkaline phosphatase superfamily)